MTLVCEVLQTMQEKSPNSKLERVCFSGRDINIELGDCSGILGALFLLYNCVPNK